MLQRPRLAALLAATAIAVTFFFCLALLWWGPVKELKDALELAASLVLVEITTGYAALTFALAREGRENITATLRAAQATEESVAEQRHANDLTRRALDFDEYRYLSLERARLDEQAPEVLIYTGSCRLWPPTEERDTYELTLGIVVFPSGDKPCCVWLPATWLGCQRQSHETPYFTVPANERTDVSTLWTVPEQVASAGTELEPLELRVTPVRHGIVEDVYRLSGEITMRTGELCFEPTSNGFAHHQRLYPQLEHWHPPGS